MIRCQNKDQHTTLSVSITAVIYVCLSKNYMKSLPITSCFTSKKPHKNEINKRKDMQKIPRFSCFDDNPVIDSKSVILNGLRRDITLPQFI